MRIQKVVIFVLLAAPFFGAAQLAASASPSALSAKLSPIPQAGLVVAPVGGVHALAANVGSVDVGTVGAQEAAVTRDFVLKNAGSLPLTITELQPSCDCTSAVFDPAPLGRDARETLLPGGRVTVKMTVRLSGRGPGEFTHSIFVCVKDRPQNVAMLQIVGILKTASKP